MFVEMKKELGMNAFECDVLIKKYRNDANGLTPDDAMKILEYTNHYANIKKVVKEINKFETAEKRFKFKEFVLAAVEGREVTPEAFDSLYKLAVEGDYVREFLYAFAKPKFYKIKDCNMISKGFELDDDTIFSTLDLKDCDKAVFDYHKCSKGTSVSVSENVLPLVSIFKNLTELNFNGEGLKDVEDLILENVETVKFSYLNNNRLQNVDLSGCKNVYFTFVELEHCANIKFGEGATVKFSSIASMPQSMDLSLASNINLESCDLSNWDNWNTRGGESISLQKAINIPKRLDLSGFDEVCLCGCDLTGVEEIKFKDGAKVDFGYRSNMGTPAKLDVTKIDFTKFGKVILENVDFSALSELKFRDDAIVELRECRGFPKSLDFSNTDVTIFRGCDFVGVEELKLKGGPKISIFEAKNLLCSLDLSSYDAVDMKMCDLSQMTDIKFNEEGKVEFDRVIFPEVLDLSGIKDVKLSSVNLGNVKEIKFREGGEACFSFVEDFSDDFSISQLEDVTFSKCNLSNIKKLVAREGSKLYITDYSEYPKVLDVSRCKNAQLIGDIREMHRVVFKNRKQRDASIYEPSFLDDAKELAYLLMRRAKFRYVEGKIVEAINAKKQQMNNGAER